MDKLTILAELRTLLKNIQDWNILYLKLKDAQLEKMKTHADCDIAGKLWFAVMEGAAFLPDVLKQIVSVVDNEVWLDDMEHKGALSLVQECKVLLAMDRPEPMRETLWEFRKRLHSRRIEITQQKKKFKRVG